MKKLLSLILLLALASSAFAECVLYIDDFTVKRSDIGSNVEITVPVKASFTARLNGWDLMIEYPEHLIPTHLEAGEDMTVTYYNARGREATVKPPLNGAMEPWDHVLAFIGEAGFWQDPNGEDPTAWVSYGAVKWEGGEYDEMLLLSFIVEEGFEGGDIILSTECASGNDTRGGTIQENGDHRGWHDRVCHVDVEGTIFEVDNIRYRKTSDTTVCVIRNKEIENYYHDEVNIPETVTYEGQTYTVTAIDGSAFSGCSGLTSVTIPNSVTTIGSFAFSGCSGLTSMDIPNSIMSINSSAFSGCSGLMRVNINDLSAWCGISFGDVNANPLGFAHHIILNGEEIKDLIIPNSVKSINFATFYGCSGLTSVIIPESVTAIGESAFRFCSGLTNIIIPSSVTTISQNAFYDCHGLNEIYCYAVTPPITQYNSFYNCYNATLYVPFDAVDSYKATDYWKNFIEIIGINNIFEVDGISYRSLNYKNAIVIANEEIENYYTGDVEIPAMVTYGEDTFTVIGIDENAFDGCYELTSVVIPYSVTSIGKQAFQGCMGLTSILIGEGVSAIGAQAFNYCYALIEVTCKGTVPPAMANSNCFNLTTYNNATLRVPRDSQAAYSTANYWFKFTTIEGFGSAGPGDVNGDGIVGVADVTILMDCILGHISNNDLYIESADLNNNGRIDIGDASTIIDMLINGDKKVLNGIKSRLEKLLGTEGLDLSLHD